MNKIDIINRISMLRLRANLSARALSQKIEMNDGYINRLESKKDFLPSLEVLLKIIEVCNSSVEEFFYHNFNDYKKDNQLINLLNTISTEKKDIIIKLLQTN